MKQTLQCNANGDFTVLVVADPQCETDAQWTEAKVELETLVSKTNPDFVLINGDMETNNNIPMEGWAEFVSPLTKRKIPWSTTNGNHDPFDPAINEIYTAHDLCKNHLVSETDEHYEPTRPLNYCIPVFKNDGTAVVFAIYGMDSGAGGVEHWEGFTEKQIRWYQRCSDRLKECNHGQPVVSLMCCHIPFEETEHMHVLDGICNEGITCTAPENNRGTLAAIKKQRDVKIAVFGHSHKINRVGIYQDVLLCYAGKVSSGSYHDELSRGGRVIRFHQDAPEHFTTGWVAAIPTSKDQPEIGLCPNTTNQ